MAKSGRCQIWQLPDIANFGKMLLCQLLPNLAQSNLQNWPKLASEHSSEQQISTRFINGSYGFGNGHIIYLSARYHSFNIQSSTK